MVDHHCNGVKDSPTLNPVLKQNGRLGIALTDTEKKQVLAFLKTLPDDTCINNRAFSAN